MMTYYHDDFHSGSAAVSIAIRDEIGALVPSVHLAKGAFRDVVSRIFSLGCRLDMRNKVVVGYNQSVAEAVDDLLHDTTATHLFQQQ